MVETVRPHADAPAETESPARHIALLRFVWNALYWGLLRNESFAHASNLAFSFLSSLFPFLILLTGLAGYWGGPELANAAADGLFLVFPEELAKMLRPEVRSVLSGPQAQVLTVGGVLLVIIVTGLIESLRMGLNYAYRTYDDRHFLIRRLESTFFLLVGMVIILGLGFLMIFLSIAWSLLTPRVPELVPYWSYFNRLPLVLFTLAMFFFVLAAHLWLPARQHTLLGVLPGVIVTLVLWFVAGLVFSYYLSHFANYTRTYAGLAGALASLLFFYIAGLIFQFGAELNHAIAVGGAVSSDLAYEL